MVPTTPAKKNAFRNILQLKIKILSQNSDRSIQVSKTCKILGKMHLSFLPINRDNRQRVVHFHQHESQSLRLLDVFYVCSFLWLQTFLINFFSRWRSWGNSILSRKFLIKPSVFHQFRSFDWKLRYLMLTYFLLGINWSGFTIWCLNRVPPSFCNQLKTAQSIFFYRFLFRTLIILSLFSTSTWRVFISSTNSSSRSLKTSLTFSNCFLFSTPWSSTSIVSSRVAIFSS